MASICFYFQVHQPLRIQSDPNKFDNSYFGLGDESSSNYEILKKVKDKCYLPTNKILLDLIKKFPEFKVSFSISGILIDQLENEFPEVIDSFKALVDTGNVEILGETYYHSLAFIYSKEEFKRQVIMHREKIQEVFGVTPSVFRNTELIYSNDLAKFIEEMGYKGILAEGADRILNWKSPTSLYKPARTNNIKLLLKHYRLSDDIAFRFSNHLWFGFPLTADKFAQRVNRIDLLGGDIVNLFMDYETFGEHQWEVTGIFEFLKWLPYEIYKYENLDFITPSEVINKYSVKGELNVEEYISWADLERDVSAWVSNDMQKKAIHEIYSLEDKVMSSGDEEIIKDWRTLQTSDHFYYMCTKNYNGDSGDQDVHTYFSPYSSPRKSFELYMEVLEDLKKRLRLLN